MKVTLSVIKKIHRESIVEWVKLRIKSMIWNIRKRKTFNQDSKKKKRISPQKREAKEPLGQLQTHQHLNHRGARRRRERARH